MGKSTYKFMFFNNITDFHNQFPLEKWSTEFLHNFRSFDEQSLVNNMSTHAQKCNIQEGTTLYVVKETGFAILYKAIPK